MIRQPRGRPASDRDWRRQSRRIRRQLWTGRVNRYLDRYLIHRLPRLRQVWGFMAIWLGLIGLIGLGIGFQFRALTPYYTEVVAQPGGTYVEGVVGEISNLNPAYATTTADQVATRLLFAGLMGYDADSRLQLDLAESLEVTGDNNREYTAVLKQGLVWHDGQPITAADVVFTVETIQNPASQSPLRTTWEGIGVEAVDSRTVRFFLPGSFSPFPILLTAGILPSHLLAEIPPEQLRGADFNQQPVGSGPFRFNRFVPLTTGRELRLELEANLDYHGSGPPTNQPQPPKLSGVAIWAVPDSARLAELFNQGKLSGAFNLTPEQVTLPASGYHRIKLVSTDGIYLFFNNSHPWLSAAEFRRALAASLDRDQLLDDFDYPLEPLTGPLLPDHIGYDAAIKGQDYDPAESTRLLEALGWERNGDGRWSYDDKPLRLDLTVPAGTVYEELAELIQAQFDRAGVDLRLDHRDRNQFNREILRNHDYTDLLLYGLELGPDPDVFSFWHSSQIDSHSILRFNLAEYRSVTADTALDQARSRIDPEIRIARYQDFQKVWQSDLPAVPLYRPAFHYYILASVQGPADRQLINRPHLLVDIVDWTVIDDRRWRPVRPVPGLVD